MNKICWNLAVCLGATLPTVGNAQTAFSLDSRPELHSKMRAQDRVFHGIHNAPFGIGIDCALPDMETLPLVQAYASGTGTVQAETGKHPFELVTSYSGPAGIGLRGGGAAFATAFRYRALKSEGADEVTLAAARLDVVRALETLHVVVAITGEPGRVARGVQRLKPENPNDPPIPLADLRDPVPLFDGDGNPLPPEKTNGTPRADNSGGELPPGEWSWEDSCSKDQLIGWVTAMGTLYDAAKGDPNIDQALVERLATDAAAVGAMLMEKHEFEVLGGEPEFFDLVIMDADGRPTKHHDLNPSGLDGIWFSSSAGPVNPLNLMMSIGIVKTLHHVSGDAALEAFLYEELLGNRAWLDAIPTTPEDAGFYAGPGTNFSTVNMAALGIFNALHYETDPEVVAPLLTWLETVFWAPIDQPRGAQHLKQPYFHAIYLMNTAEGTTQSLVDEAAALLQDFNLGPYLSSPKENCDADELAAGQCLALDGVTMITVDPKLNWHDKPVATVALDPSIRPTSNFDARSDPFRVNAESSSTELLPAGDLLSAYWMLRYMPLQSAGDRAVSPNAREHMPVGGAPPNLADDVAGEDVGGGREDAGSAPDAGSDQDVGIGEDAVSGPDDDTGQATVDIDLVTDTVGGANTSTSPDDGGCSAIPSSRPAAPWWMALVLLSAWLLRRRAVQRS